MAARGACPSGFAFMIYFTDRIPPNRWLASANTARRDTGRRDINTPERSEREDRRRRRLVRSCAVTADCARHPISVRRNSPVADVTRPRVNDVCGGVHIPGVAGARDDGVFALEILRGRIL